MQKQSYEEVIVLAILANQPKEATIYNTTQDSLELFKFQRFECYKRTRELFMISPKTT